MAYSSINDSGKATWNSWRQLTLAEKEAIFTLEPSENLAPLKDVDLRYAALVHVVNPTEISVSGEGLEVNTDNLEEIVKEIDIEGTYERIIHTVGDDTYICHAPPNIGNNINTTDVWRVQKINSAGSRSFAVDGGDYANSTKFNKSAKLSAVTGYSYACDVVESV